jgi:hypothetical protein
MAQFISEDEYSFAAPAGLNIYRLRRPEAGHADIRRLGGRFGMAGTIEEGTFVQNARETRYSEPSGWELRLSVASGGWRYRHAERWQADDRQSNLTVDDEGAARLALKELRKYALPVPPELQLLGVQRLRVAHCERGGNNYEERIVGVRALYRRMLDGLLVEGPGGHTVVYLDHQSELSGIDHMWRDIENVYEPVTRLRPVEEAFDEVRRRYGRGEGRIEVLDVRLAYYELGWEVLQEYLQPAYVVNVRLTGTDERFRMNAVVPVAAAVNAVAPIEPIQPPRRPQEARPR